jgi:carbonic anhydrase
MKWFIGVIIVASVLAVQSRHTNVNFRYSAQNKWPGACTSGQKQSPINVITKDVKCNTSLTALQFSNQYFKRISGNFENDGHSVVFTPYWRINAVMTTPVGQYKLLSIHMHWGSARHRGSEHLVDSKASDLEVHFVHVKQHAQDKTASDYHAVLSVRGSRQSNKLTETFTKLAVRKVRKYHSKIYVSGIRLSSLIPSNLDYYYYQGSLTTPSCDQNVQWFLLKNKIGVDFYYLAMLAQGYVHTSDGKSIVSNCRQIQPLNGRTVTQVHLIVLLMHLGLPSS